MICVDQLTLLLSISILSLEAVRKQYVLGGSKSDSNFSVGSGSKGYCRGSGSAKTFDASSAPNKSQKHILNTTFQQYSVNRNRS